jgi:DNA-binding MarR family transcriptional regulator
MPTTTGQDARGVAELAGLPGHLIRRVHQVSVALFAEECGDLDLTPVQYGAMVAIRANPGVDATRLAALIDFDRSTTGDVLDRLVSKRWVLRRASLTDRRVKLLRLSAAGERIVDAAAPAVRRVQERLLEPLAPADRDTLIRLLARAAGVDEETLPSWRGA